MGSLNKCFKKLMEYTYRKFICTHFIFIHEKGVLLMLATLFLSTPARMIDPKMDGG